MKYVIIVEPKLEKNFGKDKNGEDRVLTEDEDLIIQSLEQEVHQATQDIRINIGKYEVKILNDGWTAVTKDKSLSAQFEHTVGITENGYEIFTESGKGYTKPPY